MRRMVFGQFLPTHEVGDDDFSSGLGHAGHLPKRITRIVEMGKSGNADHMVEGIVLEGIRSSRRFRTSSG